MARSTGWFAERLLKTFTYQGKCVGKKSRVGSISKVCSYQFEQMRSANWDVAKLRMKEITKGAEFHRLISFHAGHELCARLKPQTGWNEDKNQLGDKPVSTRAQVRWAPERILVESARLVEYRLSSSQQCWPVGLGQLARQKVCEIGTGHLMLDNVHMMISIPPKYSVAGGGFRAESIKVQFSLPGCTAGRGGQTCPPTSGAIERGASAFGLPITRDLLKLLSHQMLVAAIVRLHLWVAWPNRLLVLPPTHSCRPYLKVIN